MTTIIKKEYPPNIDQIRAVFDIKDRKDVVFTYGETIYNPGGGQIDDPLLYHEMTHTIQQGDKAEAWWRRYLVDDDFRFVQELEAYQNQYKRFCDLVKDRNSRARFLIKIASTLASDLYGKVCTTNEAMIAIKTGKKFNVNGK